MLLDGGRDIKMDYGDSITKEGIMNLANSLTE